LIREGSPLERDFEKILADEENMVYVENWEIKEDEKGTSGEWSIKKQRLHGGLSDGVDLVTIDNGKLLFHIVPTRGMSIWKGSTMGIPVGWDSPMKSLVHPGFINIMSRGGLGWLEGFSECVVRCGLGNFGAAGEDTIIDNMGREKKVTLSLHGRIANMPASFVKAFVRSGSQIELGIEGVVYERAMFGPNLRLTSSITTNVSSKRIRIFDTIKNLRSVPEEMQILYHCNFGRPFLEEGAKLVVPLSKVAPRDGIAEKNIDGFDTFDAPSSGFIEQVYYMQLLGDENDNSMVMLVNSKEDKAISLSFSLRELPYFTLWKNTNSEDEGYVVGLEPGTSFPNNKGFERRKNRLVKMNPKQKYEVKIDFEVLIGRSDIEKKLRNIRNLQQKEKPRIYPNPLEEFSPS
jgi:hypothetical protein